MSSSFKSMGAFFWEYSGIWTLSQNRRYFCSDIRMNRMKGIRFTRNRQNMRFGGNFLAGNPTQPQIIVVVFRSPPPWVFLVSSSFNCIKHACRALSVNRFSITNASWLYKKIHIKKQLETCFANLLGHSLRSSRLKYIIWITSNRCDSLLARIIEETGLRWSQSLILCPSLYIFLKLFRIYAFLKVMVI